LIALIALGADVSAIRPNRNADLLELLGIGAERPGSRKHTIQLEEIVHDQEHSGNVFHTVF
jgi:hypothetical protein